MNETRMITGVDFVTVPAPRFADAVGFYQDVLGLPCSKRYRDDIGVEFETGNLTLQVLDIGKLGLQLEPSTNPIALHVDDFEGAQRELASRGVSFMGDVLDSGVCWQAFFKDPNGNALAIHHRYAPPDAMPGD
jgi:predicted enzyme related to lactoylglutathione lyase